MVNDKFSRNTHTNLNERKLTRWPVSSTILYTMYTRAGFGGKCALTKIFRDYVAAVTWPPILIEIREMSAISHWVSSVIERIHWLDNTDWLRTDGRQHTGPSEMTSHSCASRRQSLETGRTLVPAALRISATRTVPSLPGRGLMTRPSDHWHRGNLSSVISTISFSQIWRTGRRHLARGDNWGMYSSRNYSTSVVKYTGRGASVCDE